MKVAIVKFSQLGTGCWSPRRFVGNCSECERVERCKLPEAREGRIGKRMHGVEYAKAKLMRAEERLQQTEQKNRW